MKSGSSLAIQVESVTGFRTISQTRLVLQGVIVHLVEFYSIENGYFYSRTTPNHTPLHGPGKRFKHSKRLNFLHIQHTLPKHSDYQLFHSMTYLLDEVKRGCREFFVSEDKRWSSDHRVKLPFKLNVCLLL